MSPALENAMGWVLVGLGVTVTVYGLSLAVLIVVFLSVRLGQRR